MNQDPPIMWEPKENSGLRMKHFMSRIQEKYSIQFADYWEFHQWSIDNLTEFWSEMWDYSEIICSEKFKKVIDLDTPMKNCPKWFEGAKLNYAENLLKYRDDKICLYVAGEDRKSDTMTYAQLYEEVCLYAAAFRKLGLKKGDIVACYMSNRKEAILAMIATVSTGAIWTGALPQMGSQAALNRLTQLNPKFLIAVDRFSYDNEENPLLPNIKEITEGLPSLEKVIIVPSNENSKRNDISQIRSSCFLEDFLESGKEPNGTTPPITFEQVDISHPIFISFTSGTTGLPKPIMHGSGILPSLTKDFGVHLDTTRESVWLAISPVGWGLWNMCVTLLSMGSRVVLFEGYPYFLGPTTFWDLVDEFKITHSFVPASVIDEFEKRKSLPTEKHDVSSLKVIMGCGSVVKPRSYDFMYKHVKGNVAFSSGFGSTEFFGCPFVVEQTLPVYRGEINAITLGYSVQCLDEQGKPVLGEKGELVVSKPSPNILLGIWGDKDGSKCREKYYSKFQGQFLVGDHGIINPVTKGLYICGRSDETLKQRGSRFGSSEIYNVVELFPEVRDSLCVSHYNKSMDERAVLFLKMREGHRFTEDFLTKIRAAITEELTALHIPDVIMEIEDIPYNMNGKKLELLVKNIINKRPYNTESVSNPDSLKYYINIKGLTEF